MSKSNTKGCVKVLVMKNTGLQKMKTKRLHRTHGTQGQYYHHGIPAVGKSMEFLYRFILYSQKQNQEKRWITYVIYQAK